MFLYASKASDLGGSILYIKIVNLSNFLLPVVLIAGLLYSFHLLVRRNYSLFDPLSLFVLVSTVTFALHQFSGLYTITYLTPLAWFLYLTYAFTAIISIATGARFARSRSSQGGVQACQGTMLLRVLVYGLLSVSILAAVISIASNLGALLSGDFSELRVRAVENKVTEGGFSDYLDRFIYVMFLAVPLIMANPQVFKTREKFFLLALILAIAFGRSLITSGRWPLFLAILVFTSSLIPSFSIRRIKGVWVFLAIGSAGLGMILLGQIRSRGAAERYDFESVGYHAWIRPMIELSPITARAYFQSVSYFTQGIVHFSMYLDDAKPNRRGYLTTRFIQLRLGTMYSSTLFDETEKLHSPIFYYRAGSSDQYHAVWATGYRLFVQDFGYIGGGVATVFLGFLAGYLYQSVKYKRSPANLMALVVVYPTLVMMPVSSTLLHPNFLFLMNGYLIVYFPLKILELGPLRLKPLAIHT